MFKRVFLVAVVGLLTTGARADVFRITYDLTGSTLKISGTPLNAGDGTFSIGPGQITLEFSDASGTPDVGLCAMVHFGVDVEFPAGNAAARVDSDLFVFADFDTTIKNSRAVLESGQMSWIDNVPYRTVGTNLCNGALCSLGGLPNGTPVTRDDAVSLTFNPFVFGAGGPAEGAGFTMAELVVSTADNINTSLRLVGTESSRTLLRGCKVNKCFGVHTADRDNDNVISLSELLRLVQLFNAGGFGCDVKAEDLYSPDSTATNCDAHALDYSTQNFRFDFSELLRGVQLFNFGRYNYCANGTTPDPYCKL